MKTQIIKFMVSIPVLFLIALCSCSTDSPDTEFTLANSQTSSSSRLDILYDNDFTGNISYIVSPADLGINKKSEFNASTATKQTATVTADDIDDNDYIAIKSLSPGKQYYVYILNTGTGHVEAYTLATRTSSTSTSVTGTFTGYSGSSISYTISFPAAYDGSSSETWPLVLSVKAPNFTAADGNFPCITFNTDISYSSLAQSNYDIDALKARIKSVIESNIYNIDKTRVYACGFSAGGCAVMKIANDDGSDQYKITAIAANGISGWLGSNPDWTGNLGDTDIWISCGENDPYEAWVAYADMPKTSGDHLLSIYPGLGHDSSRTWDSPYTFMWLLSK